MKLEAVVFDMDGLMFDTENLWLIGVDLTNKNHGYNVPRELIISCMGNRSDVISQKLKAAMGDDFDTDTFKKLNSYYMQKYVEENGLKVKEGLQNLLDFLKEHNIKMAVASSSKLSKIEERFKQANISMDYFDQIIGGDMVTKPKPDPEVYLKACEMLGVNPKNTIALDDSEYGIMSALNANMIAINIPDLKPPFNKATKVLKDLNEVVIYIKNNFAL